MITSFANPQYFKHCELARIKDGSLAAAINAMVFMNRRDIQRVAVLAHLSKLPRSLSWTSSYLLSDAAEEVTAYEIRSKYEIDREIENRKLHPFYQFKGIKDKNFHEIDASQYSRIQSYSDKEGQIRIQSQIELMNAIKRWNSNDIRKAIRSGADVNYQSVLKNVWDTPLVRAFGMFYSLDDRSGSKTETIRTLLEEGADVNLTSPRGCSPLMLASFLPVTHHLIPLLVKSGASLNAKDEKGDTAFIQAARCKESAAAMKELYDAGADHLMRNNRGKTAMHIATAAGATANIGILKTLIDGNSLHDVITAHHQVSSLANASPKLSRRPGIL